MLHPTKDRGQYNQIWLGVHSEAVNGSMYGQGEDEDEDFPDEEQEEDEDFEGEEEELLGIN